MSENIPEEIRIEWKDNEDENNAFYWNENVPHITNPLCLQSKEHNRGMKGVTWVYYDKKVAKKLYDFLKSIFEDELPQIISSLKEHNSQGGTNPIKGIKKCLEDIDGYCLDLEVIFNFNEDMYKNSKFGKILESCKTKEEFIKKLKDKSEESPKTKEIISDLISISGGIAGVVNQMFDERLKTILSELSYKTLTNATKLEKINKELI